MSTGAVSGPAGLRDRTAVVGSGDAGCAVVAHLAMAVASGQARVGLAQHGVAGVAGRRRAAKPTVGPAAPFASPVRGIAMPRWVRDR